ncbi:MAG: HlyC/CorC family transporter [Rickettsiales bacterium]
MPELDSELAFYGLTILLFLLISAFFSASETALTAVSRARIYQLVMDGNKRARTVSKLRREKESMIGAILLGNNAVNIASSAIATLLAIQLFGDENGLLFVTIVMTLIVVIFCEVLPKTYAIQNAERVSLLFSPALSIIVKLLSPITLTIQLFIRSLLRLFGIDITKSNMLVSATDVVRGTIELHHREGSMIKQDRDMLGSILDLHDIEVGDVMLHRKEVETLNADQPADELVQCAVTNSHSRIPLWRDDPDNIIGLLHVKDLIATLNTNNGTITNEQIISIATKPWFIPEITSLRSQLIAFRNRRKHFAFVIDEYGDWQGIVTLEDIIEEIVGDIDDEHDERTKDIQKLTERVYLINGSATLRDVNRQLDWSLPDDDASTMAGLLIHEAQTIPETGEHFIMHGFRFTVAEKEDTQITLLRVEQLIEAYPQDDVEL